MRDYEASELELKEAMLRVLLTEERQQKQKTKVRMYAILLCCSLVAAVLSVKGWAGKYDSSGSCLLNDQCTETTRTNGDSKEVSYHVTYKFAVRGQEFTGSGEVLQQPESRDARVYYMAANPQDNSLKPRRVNDYALAGTGIAVLIALIAFAKLPKNRSIAVPRGKYNASGHVAFAFFVQTGIVGVLLAHLVSSVLKVPPTSYGPLCLATVGAVLLTLGIYLDKWGYIEAYSSKFCSGVSNVSILYVPAVAIFYANYHALKRLFGGKSRYTV